MGWDFQSLTKWMSYFYPLDDGPNFFLDAQFTCLIANDFGEIGK